ncbi:MAG: hypothetical protein IT385_20645 [Deltaproteobacteria bacterium]|nr:hypothetical protein [Deltaproteobacteria bacterium]
MRNDWYDAGIQILTEAANLPDADVARLAEVRAAYLHAKGSQPADLSANVISREEMEVHFPISLPAQLAVQLLSVIPDGPERQPMTARLRETYIRLVNANNWTTIERQITPREGPTLTSRITPVNQAYDDTYHGERGVDGKRYGHTGFGSMGPRLGGEGRSHEETHRPTNLWHSTLTADGQTLFDAFRSGAFADPVLADSATRRMASDSKAIGVLEAMVIKQLRQMSPADAEKVIRGDDSLTSTVVAIDLLSDGALKGFSDQEAVESHHKTIGYISGKELPYKIQFAGREVTVKATFKIVDFNLAVNQLGSNLQFTGRRQGKHNTSKKGDLRQLLDEYNRVTQVAMSMDGADVEDLKKRQLQVNALYKQFKTLGPTHVGNYEAAAILGNMAHLMGHEVHFNCKSGKDRTGLMDANSKHLAAELGRRRADPNLHERYLTPEPGWLDQTHGPAAEGRRQMIWESGNLQVLEKNVGGQSLKVGDAAKVPMSIDSALRDNVGGAEHLKELRGLADYTMIDTATEIPKADKKTPEVVRARAMAELEQMIREARGGQPPG